MERWSKRVALVTGASSGIGATIARSLVEAGMVVIGADRDTQRIEDMSIELERKPGPGRLVVVRCDVTKDEDLANLFTYIKKDYKGVDVCINNVGMSWNHGLLDGTVDEWRYMMDVNVIALCQCTKESVNSMIARGVDDGHVIHLNSILGHYVYPNPTVNFYTATKHAVTALTEGLRNELRIKKSNIRISCISPGIVHTEFVGRMIGDHDEGNKMYQSRPHIMPHDVAASVCHILAAPPNVQIHDLMIRAVGEGELAIVMDK